MDRIARALVTLVLAAATPIALAQSFPTKPVKWIVPFAAGGPADAIARLVGPRLNEALGQPVIIDNRAGAASNIGHEAAARAAPDGYTILYVVPNVVTNPSLFKNMVDPLTELMPVAQMTVMSYVLLASRDFGPKTVPEVVEAARTRPQGMTCANGGGLPEFCCAWLRTVTGTNIINVRYKGNAPAMTDLLAGRVDVLIDLFNTALPQIRAGHVRPIALTAAKRGPPLPELPVIAETYPGLVLVGWHGVMAPAGVPKPVIDTLNAAFDKALADPPVNKRIADTGINVAHTSAEEFGRILREDYVKYARIVKEAGITQQ